MTAEQLQAALAALPRVHLGTLPTPLQDAPRLAYEIGIGRLLIKRDDLTGLAFGGNKVRQMEFFLGEARAQDADTVIAGGSFDQSNHARVAAAAARAAGMRSIIVARPGGQHPGPTGNGLLSRMIADEFRVLDELADAPADRVAEVRLRAEVFGRIADEQRGLGRRPYVITGSTVPLGAMGYVAGALELCEQVATAGIERPILAVTSTGATQAGLEVANRVLGEPFRVQGLAYGYTGGQGPTWVAGLATGAATLLGFDLRFEPSAIANEDAPPGATYGLLTPERLEALRLALRTETLLLDPVYNATGLATLQRMAREGRIGPSDIVVFIHTGGLPALFAYGDDLLRT